MKNLLEAIGDEVPHQRLCSQRTALPAMAFANHFLTRAVVEIDLTRAVVKIEGIT